MAMAMPMFSACATAGETSHEGIDSGPTDGKPLVDAPPQHDGPPGCTTTSVELLMNPAFDATPIGMGWTETPINVAYPIVTATGALAPQSPANKAWLGGLAAANANDSIYQDVAVPASATQLVLTGFYDVRTSELSTTVYDRGTVELVRTDGTTIVEPILALDNAHATTGWTAINHPITAAVAGTTVRLRLSSASDVSFATSFYFDSVSLTATSCQ